MQSFLKGACEIVDEDSRIALDANNNLLLLHERLEPFEDGGPAACAIGGRRVDRKERMFVVHRIQASLSSGMAPSSAASRPSSPARTSTLPQGVQACWSRKDWIKRT